MDTFEMITIRMRKAVLFTNKKLPMLAPMGVKAVIVFRFSSSVVFPLDMPMPMPWAHVLMKRLSSKFTFPINGKMNAPTTKQNLDYGFYVRDPEGIPVQIVGT